MFVNNDRINSQMCRAEDECGLGYFNQLNLCGVNTIRVCSTEVQAPHGLNDDGGYESH